PEDITYRLKTPAESPDSTQGSVQALAKLAKLAAHQESADMKSGKTRSSKDRVRREAAEMLAVAALSFLASEPEHLGQFLAATGIGPDQIRNAARDRSFLSGVLDHLSG